MEIYGSMKIYESISVLAINNVRDREQFGKPATGAVTRKIDSDLDGYD